jgi:hypothetical protein
MEPSSQLQENRKLSMILFNLLYPISIYFGLGLILLCSRLSPVYLCICFTRHPMPQLIDHFTRLCLTAPAHSFGKLVQRKIPHAFLNQEHCQRTKYILPWRDNLPTSPEPSLVPSLQQAGHFHLFPIPLKELKA